jgi:signal transduction histidine kinase
MPALASVYFGYYKTGRFIFALALLISFQMVGLLAFVPNLFYILSVYSLVALIMLLSGKSIGHFDFILDIIFISAMVYVSFGVYSYLTLFYLFPIFISSLNIKTPQIFIYPVMTTFCYASIFGVRGNILLKESIFNILLHAISFFLIAFAANSLSLRMARQDIYIKSLEDERIRMLGYERLYRVSADLAHELRNPLASISAAVQFLKEGKIRREFIDMVSTETARLTALVNDFLMFSRPSDAPKEEIDLAEMIDMIIARQQNAISIIRDVECGIAIMGNKVYLDSAFSNIIKNAIEAARTSIRITLKRGSDKGGGDLLFEVEDDGDGINETVRERLFEPFVTTKKDGTGLGLALAYRVVTTMGGNISIGSSLLGGARVTVVIPDAVEYGHKKGS